MNALVRTGWLLSAALFATLLSSIRHVDHVGAAAYLLLLAVVVVAALRPGAGAIIAVAGAPLAWYFLSWPWNPTVAWAEAIACAALTGLSINFFLQGGARARRVPGAVAAPAILFGALVIASVIASLGIKALVLGPGFAAALVTQLAREYFIDVRGFPALHAGMLLLEGVLLFAAAARIAADRASDDRFLRRVTAAAAAAATLAAALNIGALLGAAWRAESFWASLVDLADRVRWNVHYGDFNAAGSYFVMAALLAAGLAAGSQGLRRLAWAAAAAAMAVAMWLTSSRVAVLAGVIALGGALLVREVAGGRTRAMRAFVIGAAAVALLGVLVFVLPQRGTQKSSFLAADVRLGLIQTGARMIASHPVFGLGLGEFYRRSPEFSSPELIAKFPAVAWHENAHNNYIQVTAELGLAAGILFTWMIAAALVTFARRASVNDPRLMLTLAAVAAFALTCLGGHPLLIPEPGYVFWAMLGAAAGSVAAPAEARRGRVRWLVPICLVAIAITMPWRIRATTRDADLEHVGIGVSLWRTSPDDIRYREAVGHATLFIPNGAVRWRWSVYPLADQPVRLELTLDGRLADVVTLAPRQWNALTLPARSEPQGARSPRLDLRLLDSDQTAMWITKVLPIQ